MRFSAPLAAAALLSALLCGFAPPTAVARVRGNLAVGGSGGGAIAAPSSAARSAALTQITGLAPGQISSQRACPAAAPGVATCEAHVAVLRTSGTPVRPRVHRDPAVTEVRPRLDAPAFAFGAAAGPAAATAPAVAGPTAAAAGQPAPEVGTPAWLQQAYDLTYLSSTQGGGATVAVVDAYDDPAAASDLATFRAEYGLPACGAGCFEKVNQWGSTSSFPGTSPGWLTEESLDLDAVSSLCPNCHIILVEARSAGAADLARALHTAVTLGATQISASWALVSSTPISAFATPTVPTVAATGDTGYLGTANDAYPAAIPGFTAAGGTTLSGAAGGPRGYADTAWSNAGSGCDRQEAKPAYQTAAGCAGRAYADVSADADPNTGLTIYNSAQGGWMLAGGTSLATPLIAAYEAVTGVSGLTPQWAYADSSLLNDPISGSNGGSYGTCAAALAYICTAGAGYDGPTGAGAISGQVANGGPGIGGPTQGTADSYVQSVTATSAALTGGVYPNGNDTTYWWQYGPTTGYGEQTPETDAGAGSASVAVSGTFSDLVPASTYHYRLVASNSAGTTYGYDYTLTTPSADPAVSAAQSSSAGAGSGGSTSVSGGSTSVSGGSTSVSGGSTFVSGGSTSGSGGSPSAGGGSSSGSGSSSSGTGATGGSVSGGQPAPGTGTGSPPAGGVPAPVLTSPQLSARPATAAPVIASAPRLTGAARSGSRLTIRGGSFRNGRLSAVSYERCARTCRTVARGTSRTYRLTRADAGYFIRARITVSGPGGVVVAWAAGERGPVGSPRAGSASLRAGARMIRGTQGHALARVSLQPRRPAHGRAARAARRAGRVRSRTTVHVTRAGFRGHLTVWACAGRGGSVWCTAPRAVGGQLTFTLSLAAGEAVRLVAVA